MSRVVVNSSHMSVPNVGQIKHQPSTSSWGRFVGGGGAPADRRGEVGVDRSGQAVVQVLLRLGVPRAEVECAGHAAGGHDPNEGVEVRPENCKERQCLSHEGSGNTRQRKCRSHEGSGNTRQRHCSMSHRPSRVAASSVSESRLEEETSSSQPTWKRSGRSRKGTKGQ